MATVQDWLPTVFTTGRYSQLWEKGAQFLIMENFPRYQRYRWYRRHRFYHADDDWDDDYYSTYYQR